MHFAPKEYSVHKNVGYKQFIDISVRTIRPKMFFKALLLGFWGHDFFVKKATVLVQCKFIHITFYCVRLYQFCSGNTGLHENTSENRSLFHFGIYFDVNSVCLEHSDIYNNTVLALW